MRIAFISYDFGEYCIQHANGLLDSGEVLLVMPKELYEPHQEMLNDKVELKTFSKPRLRQPIRQIHNLRWILKQIKEFQPDVVHFQLGHLWFNFALPIVRQRCPIVFTVHDPRQHMGDCGAKNTPQWVMDFGYRRADKVIVHGSQLKQVLFDELKISKDDIHVIPHIAIGERDLVAAGPETNELLFFGRIWPYKGLDCLIRAEPLITRECPNAKIVICGKGEGFDRYREMMSNPDQFIVHNRWISDDERRDFFQRASIVVLPYVEATQSGVVPVAYAHSKPVIATRTGGLPDVVDHGKTGLLVEPKDETELAAAIITLLKDSDLRKSMGRAGHQKLQTELSPTVVCKQTADVYRSAIRKRKPRTRASAAVQSPSDSPINQ